MRPGVPARDIVVSPQHRVLLDDWRAQLYFGANDVLVAAKHLVNGIDIRIDEGPKGITYHHLVFDRHQIISAHGLLSESFLPGELSIGGLNNRTKTKFFEEFPDLDACLDQYGAAARPMIRSFEAAMFGA
jgi:hypothetical protein